MNKETEPTGNSVITLPSAPKRKKGEKKITPSKKPANGRTWKTKAKRASASNQSKGLKNSWSRKQRQREERRAMKEQEAIVKAAEKAERAELARKREQKRAHKEANQAKSVIVQVITNTRKIKKMSRKQLRSIRKM